MNLASYKNLNLPSEEGYAELLNLQSWLNAELRECIELLKSKSKEIIARELISKVESLIDEVNTKHYKLYRGDYGGSTNYQHGEQTYCNKSIIVQFVGFSAQVYMDSWRDED